MNKRFQGMVNFSNAKKIPVKAKVNEKIIINLILRHNSKDTMILDNCKVNLYIACSENKTNIIYSNSMVNIVNKEKGLIQLEIPSFTFDRAGEFIGQVEVLDLSENNFISEEVIKFEISSPMTIAEDLESIVNIKKIETLQTLDMYIENAIEKLKELEGMMNGK